MASTTLTILAVLAAVAFASAQYPYMLFNFAQPQYYAQPAQHDNTAVHAAYKPHGVNPVMAYAMMPMPLQPSEVMPVFVPQVVAPGNEKKFGSTTHITVTTTTVIQTVSTTTKYVAG